MKKLVQVLMAACMGLSAGPLSAAVITVGASGADYTDLATAISNANPGDTVQIIDQGTYGGAQLDDVSLESNPPGATLTGFIDVVGGTVTIEDIDLEGAGIHTQNDSVVTVNRVDIIDSLSHGFLFNAGSGYDFTANNCTITNPAEQAITVWQSGTVRVNLTTINSPGDTGLKIDASADASTSVTLEGVTIINAGAVDSDANNDVAIGLYRPANLALIGCVISNPRQHGLKYDFGASGANLLIEDTRIEGAGDNAIWMGRTGTYTFRNSIFRGSFNEGIFIDDYAAAGIETVGVMEGCTIEDNGFNGVRIIGKQDAHTWTVTGNTFRGNFARAFSIESSVDTGNDITLDFRNNLCIDGSDDLETTALIWDTAASSAIVNNVIVGGVVGLGLNSRSQVDSNTVVYHNTLYGNGITETTGLALGDAMNAADSFDIQNNIVDNFDTAFGGDDVFDYTGVVSADYNLFNGLTVSASPDISETLGTNNLEGVNPAFVSGALLDLRIVETSPAVDAGNSVGVTEDFAGTARPVGAAVDMGAFEYFLLTGTRHWNIY